EHVTARAIIPVPEGGVASRQCLHALRSVDRCPDEVIIVAHGEPHGLDAVTKSWGMRTIQTPVQSGPAAARNLGASEARGTILLFIDADGTIQSSTIPEVLRVFRSHP